MEHQTFLRVLRDVIAGNEVSLPALDWSEFIAQSAQVNIAPLLYRYVIRLGVPDDALEAIRETYITNSARNLQFHNDLARVLRAFQREGIQVILLKGAFLAEAVYGNIALRPMSDIDLLVRKNDLAKAQNIFFALGCRPDSRPSLAMQCSHGHHLEPFELGRTSFDVHWNIEDDENPFEIDIDGIWQRSQPLQVQGLPVLALGTADLLLHVCLHASYHHGWLGFGMGIVPFADIAEINHKYGSGMEWPLLVKLAREWRIERCVYLTLRLANKFWLADVPVHVLDSLVEPEKFDTRLLQWAEELILADHYRAFSAKFPTVASLRLSKRIRSRTKYWVGAFFPRRETIANFYPAHAKRLYLAYAARWRDLFAEHWRLFVTADEGAVTVRRREEWRVALSDWLTSRAPASMRKTVNGRSSA